MWLTVQELDISNTQYAVLDSSESFIKVTLILLSGALTDRYGGASMYIRSVMGVLLETHTL